LNSGLDGPARLVVAVCLAGIGLLILPQCYAGVMLFVSLGEVPAPAMRESRQWSLLANTLLVSLGTALAAGVMGTVAGMALAVARGPLRAVLAVLTALPFLLPRYLVAVAWLDLLAPGGLCDRVLGIHLGDTLFSIPGVVFVLGMALYPLSAACVYGWLARRNAVHEEAALLAAPPHRVFFSVTAPVLLRGVAMGAGLASLFALLEFSVPSLFQVNVYPVEVFTSFSAFYDAPGALTNSLPILLLGIAALGALYRVRRPDGPRHERPLPLRPGWRGIVLALGGLWIGLAGLAPLGVLFWRSFPLSTYGEVFQTARPEMLTTVMLAAATATLTLLLAAGLVLFSQRARHAAPLVALPFLLSGPAWGVLTIEAWNRPGIPGAVYDSFGILWLGISGVLLVFAWVCVALARQSVPRAQLEAARVFGTGRTATATRVVLPQVWPLLCAGWLLVFVLAAAELGVSALVQPPGMATLPVRIFSLLHYGSSSMTAALGVLSSILVLAALTTAAAVFARMRRHA